MYLLDGYIKAELREHLEVWFYIHYTYDNTHTIDKDIKLKEDSIAMRNGY